MKVRRRTRLPRGALSRRSRGPLLGGAWLRLRTWRQASELTLALAEGAEPTDSDELSLRAGQLRSRKTREGVASSLHGAVRLAALPPVGPGFAPLIRRSTVRRCHRPLLELAARLNDDEVLEVPGLAKAWLLVRDGGSALFEPTHPSLTNEVDAILAALGPVAGHSSSDRSSGA